MFCGVGGLTQGLESAGINVALGVDIDSDCEYPYTTNSSASFQLNSVENLPASDINDVFDDAEFKLLAGCAPCQPFSSYTQGRSCSADDRWNLLEHFSRLVQETKPNLVTMENVPRLMREDVFANFLSVLNSEGFNVFHSVVNCADYGVPQHRRRLVLLASQLGPINITKPTTPEGSRITVRQAIGDLPTLSAGETCESDPLHRAGRLSTLNLQRIRASTPGGTWCDWDKDLRAECHTRTSGLTYKSVYGRMSWDAPSPTITTQYYGFGNGRFGHPEQDRAISLREGAIIQGFKKNCKFVPEGETIYRNRIGRLIGNAVPVGLAEAIGISLTQHIEAWHTSQAEKD